jgi:hypothetical protein
MLSKLGFLADRKIIVVPCGVFTFLAEASKPRCLALHARVPGTGEHTASQ